MYVQTFYNILCGIQFGYHSILQLGRQTPSTQTETTREREREKEREGSLGVRGRGTGLTFFLPKNLHIAAEAVSLRVQAWVCMYVAFKQYAQEAFFTLTKLK